MLGLALLDPAPAWSSIWIVDGHRDGRFRYCVREKLSAVVRPPVPKCSRGLRREGLRARRWCRTRPRRPCTYTVARIVGDENASRRHNQEGVSRS